MFPLEPSRILTSILLGYPFLQWQWRRNPSFSHAKALMKSTHAALVCALYFSKHFPICYFFLFTEIMYEIDVIIPSLQVKKKTKQ